ncbi:MAG: hypothetical protein J6J43_03995 [Oscillospiraceae bacterium]|nr:hypothetical protein [Oscillospiraceae bacterium]
MKRNNTFMFAYIVFIFLCAWVRLIYDFPMWGRIVVAITIASWAFAVSDCCTSISNLQKDTYEIQFPLVDTAKFRINQIKDCLKKRGTEKSDEATIEIVLSCEKSCERILDRISKMKKASNVLKMVAIASTFFAFLLFLCVLSFEPVYNYFFARQEGLTVLSFGMILLAQFLTNIGSGYINRNKREYEAIIDGWEALLRSYEMEEKNHAN